jgi:hypothetical protein
MGGAELLGHGPPYFREVFNKMLTCRYNHNFVIVHLYFIDFPHASIRVFAETVPAPFF